MTECATRYVSVSGGQGGRGAIQVPADASVEAIHEAMLRSAGWDRDYSNEARFAAEVAFDLIQSGRPWKSRGEIEVGGCVSVKVA
ncbi:hypothetical protein NSA19_00910 [Actinomyces bowdenii]|uniref:hypothetical protein n=1 Tax=Actinomyces bowdenii TaxID=131109 RepID=UPI00214C9A27|nr:hypothetical protein [Actinomyces bowdenii]MCR2051436.1 hypothetical protein [Actinomyces bowdenii]